MSVTKDGLIYCRKTNIRKKGLKEGVKVGLKKVRKD